MPVRAGGVQQGERAAVPHAHSRGESDPHGASPARPAVHGVAGAGGRRRRRGDARGAAGHEQEAGGVVRVDAARAAAQRARGGRGARGQAGRRGQRAGGRDGRAGGAGARVGADQGQGDGGGHAGARAAAARPRGHHALHRVPALAPHPRRDHGLTQAQAHHGVHRPWAGHDQGEHTTAAPVRSAQGEAHGGAAGPRGGQDARAPHRVHVRAAAPAREQVAHVGGGRRHGQAGQGGQRVL
mmetsp:Transcript_3572/g.8910  ORF Transcript_3572/g.8910 Transcript_3572/m.8910 type:complete len:240 (+) Transcript_3572:313-1032(+)